MFRTYSQEQHPYNIVYMIDNGPPKVLYVSLHSYSYTREKSLARQCSIKMARSAHVPLKNLTQEKSPYTLFPCSVGLCRDR